MELGSREAIREAVAAVLGVALVSRHAVRARDPRVVAVRLSGGRWTRDLLVVHRAGTPRRSSGNSDRKSTRLNSSHSQISYAVFCLKKNILVLVGAGSADLDDFLGAGD